MAIGISICCAFPLFSRVQKNSVCPIYRKQKRGQDGGETQRKHCIFNKPCQICSNPTVCKPRAQHTVRILNMPNEPRAGVCTRVQLLHPPQTGHLIQIMRGRSTQVCTERWRLQMINEDGAFKGHTGCEPIISAWAGYEPVNELEVDNKRLRCDVFRREHT